MKDSPQTLSRPAYPSDVTSRQWEQIDLLLPADSERGRHREYSLREVVNAINYRWLTGCSWRMLPHDFPQWQTVYTYFRRWQRVGLLSPLRDILLSRSLRMSPPARPAVPSKKVPEPTTKPDPAARLPQTTSGETRPWSGHSSFSHSRS